MNALTPTPITSCVPVAWREIPLVGKPRYFHAPEGMSLLEIVKNIPDLSPAFLECGIICINGDPIPRDIWHLVKPKANGKAAITLHIVLEGGGSSSKIIASVAALAIVALAAISGPLAVSALDLVPGTFAAYATQAAVSAAVSVGGALLYSALAPPPGSPAQGGAGPATDASVKAASLSGNTLRAGDNLPRVLGFRNVFPPLICQPVIELVGTNEVVEAVYGLAGPHEIDTVYVQNADISELSEIESEITEGFNDSPVQTLVSRQGFVVAPNVELASYKVNTTNDNQLLDQGSPGEDIPYYQRFVTRNAPDEFWLSLAFPEGLIRGDNGNPAMVPVRGRFRIKGTTTWTDLPEVHMRSNLQATLQVTYKLMWKKGPVALIPPDQQVGAWTAYVIVPGQVDFTPTTTGFSSDSYFYDGIGATKWFNDGTNGGRGNTDTTGIINMQLYRDRVEFYLDPAVFPQAAYEVEIIRGQPVDTSGDSWNISNYTANPSGSAAHVYDMFGYFISGGIAQVIEHLNTRMKHKITVIRQTSIWNENPVGAGAPIATIAIKATARSVQQLSCDAGGFVPIPQGGNFDTYSLSTNPADHYRDVLVGVLGAFPLQASQIDDLTQWRNDCDANGYTINCVVQGLKQFDVLKLIASAGYAKPIQAETWGVAEDKDRSLLLPTQIFTPRNFSSFQWTKTFIPFTDGLRVKFDDALNFYVESEIVVLDPAASTGGIRLEDIRYETIVNDADATRRALFDLKQVRERLVFYSGTCDVENIVCRNGDLIGVNYDVLSSEVGWARVISANITAGNVTGLNLDDSVPEPVLSFFNEPTLNFFNDPNLNFFNKPSRMGVCIRCNDGTFLVKEITADSGDATNITFVAPFANPGNIVTGCLLGFGPMGSETRRLIVSKITPKKDLTADIVFVDEAPDLFASKPVTALLHFDEASGSTTTTDSSSYANTVTTANFATSNVHAQFGACSGLFNGTSTTVQIAQTPDFHFNPQTDFTVDFWYFTASTALQGIAILLASGSQVPWKIGTDGSGNIVFSAGSIANSGFDIASAQVICPQILSTWTHFALSRIGNYFFFFQNGILQFSFYSALEITFSSANLQIGKDDTHFYNGYIDEFRYTNGIGRWLSNFTVPNAAGTP